MANQGTRFLAGGLAFKFAIRDEAGLIANFRAIDPRLQAAARRSVKRAGTRLRDIVHATVAYDTGRMHRLMRVDYSPAGLTFEAGWRAEDFLAEGEPFYPPFVEVGTYIMPAQPSLVPAWLEVQGRLRDDLADDMRRAANRISSAVK